MDVMTFMIVFMTVCILVLILCIYKVRSWYKSLEEKPNILEHLHNKDEFPLAKQIRKLRYTIFAIGMLAFILVCIFSNTLQSHYTRYLEGGILFGIIMLTILISNIVVSKLWRCPYCHERLPMRINKSGARPKAGLKSCPFCDEKLQNNDQVS